MPLESEGSRLVKSATASLVVTSASMVEYVSREDSSSCPQNKAKVRQRDRRQKCSAEATYEYYNVAYVIGCGIDIKSTDNKIYLEIRKIYGSFFGTGLEKERRYLYTKKKRDQ
jgi:hypothetical protein